MFIHVRWAMEDDMMDARQAAQVGNEERLRHLIESGKCTANSLDTDDCSLLHWAAINNRLSVARLLIEKGCNINAVGGVLASTPLHWASRHGHVHMVALLVVHGADLHYRDVEGFTPLHVAVQFGRTPTAAYLIAAGQHVDERDETMMTPAMWAAYKIPHRDPLRMLIVLGADLSCIDKTYSNTALHWSVLQSNQIAISVLLMYGADPSVRNKDNETPRDIAVRRGDLVSVKKLEKAERARGILPSTFMQCIKENKTFVASGVVIIPFLFMVTVGLLLHLSISYVTKAAAFACLTVVIHFLRPMVYADYFCSVVGTGACPIPQDIAC
ncbi:hypothetical protein AB6A40_002291 [Gnathostoma spinigerum]|uniref:Palmitoyltransferase n=1 Tax=Gnathostoma spinigerum TaxID=75299 RepID=A0ABD6E8F6_9BILA